MSDRAPQRSLRSASAADEFMPHSTYLPERTGTAVISPTGAFEAGSPQSFTLVYTAGYFGIDDTGSIKIVHRFASDMGRPQWNDPKAANIHIPVDFQNPTDEDFTRFSSAMEQLKEVPVHVHCIANYRVSAFLYRYRRDVLGMDETQARAEMEQIWHPEGVWATFVGR